MQARPFHSLTVDRLNIDCMTVICVMVQASVAREVPESPAHVKQKGKEAKKGREVQAPAAPKPAKPSEYAELLKKVSKLISLNRSVSLAATQSCWYSFCNTPHS